MRFTIDAAISTLALLLVLGGALWLPLVGANPAADMNVSIRVLGDDEGDGGGGGGAPTQATTPTTPISQTPIPQEPIIVPVPQPKIIAVTPKLISNYNRATVTIYGYNLPNNLEIAVESKTASFQTSGAKMATKSDLTKANIETVSYDILTNDLDSGVAILLVKHVGTLLHEETIWVYSRSDFLNLKAKTIPRAPSTTIVSGNETTVTLSLHNTGKTAWSQFIDPLYVGTSGPRDRQSKFLHPDWPYSNRAVRIDLTDKRIEPGQKIAVNIPLLAPSVKRTTVFIERFSLVADGLAWMPNFEFSIRITVLPLSSPPIKIDTPTAPASSPTPAKPLEANPSQDAAVPVGGLNLKPKSTSAATKTPSPYKMPNEVRSASRWMSVTTVLSNWFVKPFTSLLSTVGKLWK